MHSSTHGFQAPPTSLSMRIVSPDVIKTSRPSSAIASSTIPLRRNRPEFASNRAILSIISEASCMKEHYAPSKNRAQHIIIGNQNINQPASTSIRMSSYVAHLVNNPIEIQYYVRSVYFDVQRRRHVSVSTCWPLTTNKPRALLHHRRVSLKSKWPLCHSWKKAA